MAEKGPFVPGPIPTSQHVTRQNPGMFGLVGEMIEPEPSSEVRPLRIVLPIFILIIFASFAAMVHPLFSALLGRGTPAVIVTTVTAELMTLAALAKMPEWRGRVKELYAMRRISFTSVLGFVLFGFSMYVVSQTIPVIVESLSSIDVQSSDTSSSMKELSGSWRVLTLYVFAPFLMPLLEEFMFRGYVMGSIMSSGLRRGWAIAVSVIVSSLLFTVVHAQGLDSFTDVWVLAWVGTMSLIFAFVRLRTESIWPTVVIHSAYNLSTVVVSELLSR